MEHLGVGYMEVGNVRICLVDAHILLVYPLSHLADLADQTLGLSAMIIFIRLYNVS